MKKTVFKMIKEIKDSEPFYSYNLDVGDAFLYGENMIKQKQNKDTNDTVTYFRVTDKRRGSVMYEPIMEKLEE
jgi:hypothetical protein